MVDHNNKRRKFHDKDKYYRLAKEQGLRSRAAFKLSQINRKFPILENAKVVLDLCAAPGGWTQIASKTSNSLVIAVDILPIRPLGQPNVVTLVGDITTDQCKAAITRTLQQNSINSQVDVVLHDGAPNVGASYDKDAYQQVELALHALKCATQHLRRNGSFVTKLYRSRDYPSYVWVAKQLFQTVQAVKPTASRGQSAEIFLVCQGYHAAESSIDARMLDPKYIFESVQGDSTGGGNNSTTLNANVFSKNNKPRRQRNGYDMEHLDATMQHVQPVADFIESKTSTTNDDNPILMLSKCTGMSFCCPKCQDNNQDQEALLCNCAFYLKHANAEIRECLTDLQVLNKSDFKNLLTWRTKIQSLVKERDEQQQENDDEDASSDDDDDVQVNKQQQQQDTEDAIQAEIEQVRHLRLRQAKKVKKKERALAAKRRKRAALGMDLNAIEVPDNEKIFSLATITSKGELEAIVQTKDSSSTVVVENKSDESDEEDETNHQEDEQNDDDDDTGYSYRLDRELDEAYDLYLKTTKDGLAKSGTKMAKRSKKLQREKAAQQAQEDAQLVGAGVDQDTKAYAKMLSRDNDSDDDDDDGASSSDDDDNDDGFAAEPMTPEEHAAKNETKKKKQVNPLIYKLPDDPASVKTARWFSNPLFESIGNAAQLASMGSVKKSRLDEKESDVESIGSNDDNDDKPNNKTGINADEVLAMMPKTDKQIRHERRIKAMEREERKKARRARRAGEDEEGAAAFEVAPSKNRDENEDENVLKLDGLSESQRKKILDAQALIKAGMGTSIDQSDGKNSFEVVATEAQDDSRPLPIKDHRKYDSENEDYDSDDYVQTLALGTMMLRHSKAKALVDASYNRYAWNDPADLPDWFVDDENKHYRPQLPIPPALLQKMREKVLHLSTKPIAKVAEARARKSKRARNKLMAAKKKAEAVANSSDMSEAMKLKAISKAMRSSDAKGSGKSYVVSKKGGKTKGVKGAKMVDKRMKSDARGMERAEKKRKGGKAGGRSKKRRR